MDIALNLEAEDPSLRTGSALGGISDLERSNHPFEPLFLHQEIGLTFLSLCAPQGLCKGLLRWNFSHCSVRIGHVIQRNKSQTQLAWVM